MHTYISVTWKTSHEHYIKWNQCYLCLFFKYTWMYIYSCSRSQRKCVSWQNFGLGCAQLFAKFFLHCENLYIKLAVVT